MPAIPQTRLYRPAYPILPAMKKCFQRIILCWLIVLFSVPLHAGVIDTTGIYQRLGEWISQTQLRSAAFGFVTAEGQEYASFFGPGSWTRGDELGVDHIFRIASMTKAITSIAAMQLVEAGLVGLDDPLEDYMPEIQAIPILSGDGELLRPERPVTLRHLLTHTSGFGYAIFDRRLGGFQLPADWPHPDYPRLHEAGGDWLYGTGTDWAGRLVESISGMNLEEYLRKYITGPLGMDHTWFVVPDSLQHLLVSLVARDAVSGNVLREVPNQQLRSTVSAFSGGAGLHSSLNDYLRFLQCIVGRGEADGVRILQAATVESLFADQFPLVLTERAAEEQAGRGFAHGLAWALQAEGSDYGRRPESGYWSGYYNTYYSVDIQTGIAVVVMTNIVPPNDAEAVDLYKKFELLVRGPQP
jgi:methyl acetate hydrolase